MRLLAFKVKHFRCLFDTEWIPLSALSIFTGENDAGKSTSLQALDIFLSPKRVPVEDDFSYSINVTGENSREEELTIWAKFELRDSERSLLKTSWGVEEKEVIVKKSFHINGGLSTYLFLAKTLEDEAFKRPLDDYTVNDLKEIATRLSIDLSGLKLKQDIVDTIRRWQRLQPLVDAEVEFPKSLVESLPEFRVFSSESALDPESEIKKTLITQFRALVSADKYSGPISTITADIKSELNAELEKLTPFVQRYSDDVEAVTIRPDFNFASGLTTTALEVKRKDGKPILLQQSGAGQRRRFSLAIYEWSQDVFKDREENSRELIMAFDEPDTHLDYKSQRQIFDIIRRFAELPAIQIIVCTHSLNFIERVPINQIVHYSLAKNARSTCIEVLASTDHEVTELFLYEISRNMGLRNSVMLHERCFLAVEGPTEMAILPVLFHKKYGFPLQAAGVCLINGENNYGARMLVKFLNVNRRQVMFLVDKDSATSPSSKKLFTSDSFKIDGIDEATQVHYVGTKEVEDTFPDELWVRMADKEYPKSSGAPWTNADFSSLRLKDKFSKEVQDLIKTEAGLSRKPPKQELGYKLAQCIEAAETPREILDCLEKAFLLANR